MARPSKYSAEFRSDVIALWRASAGRRTFKDMAKAEKEWQLEREILRRAAACLAREMK
ncbi:hypothetical protein [Streptomyces sp. NBC_00829]|uniref:hypothetical protein n=1 Tax=Streptomyces sp. NBC_00829 TaxID=2903679 RepID=UPI0038668456|nr:hypothetical protein OG293_20655 [Streptomyces sp. NBC_00829]